MRWLGLSLLCLAWGCASRPRPRNQDELRWQGRGRECVRAFLGKESPYQEPIENGVADPLLASVPPEARRTAKAAGIERLVADALHVSSSGDPVSLERVSVRQDLNMRVVSLETQLSAMIFEAECTGEMIETIFNELNTRSDRREVMLAVGSLVVGALAATAAGAWDLANGDSNGPAVTGLVGGVAAAGLGAAAFVPRDMHTIYRHPHNLLTPIVQGHDEHQLYPRFVFRMLTVPSADGGPSPREQLLATWQELLEENLSKGEQADAAALLYGEGGAYDQDTISLRERMYDALETKLNALARDLELLDRFLVRSLEQPRPVISAVTSAYMGKIAALFWRRSFLAGLQARVRLTPCTACRASPCSLSSSTPTASTFPCWSASARASWGTARKHRT